MEVFAIEISETNMEAIYKSEIEYFDEDLSNGILNSGDLIDYDDNGGCQIVIQTKIDNNRQEVWIIDVSDIADWVRTQEPGVIASAVIPIKLNRQNEMMLVMTKGLTSSLTDMWGTPQAIFDELNKEFHFDVDVCAVKENAKCKNYFSPEKNGLNQEWNGTVWMNPPYGRLIKDWTKKAYDSYIEGATVVCLLPARTDTQWFQRHCLGGEIRFIEGRIKFVDINGNGNRPAPFPSIIVVLKPKIIKNEQGGVKMLDKVMYTLEEIGEMVPLTIKEIKSEIKKGNLLSKSIGSKVLVNIKWYEEWVNTPTLTKTEVKNKAEPKQKGKTKMAVVKPEPMPEEKTLEVKEDKSVYQPTEKPKRGRKKKVAVEESVTIEEAEIKADPEQVLADKPKRGRKKKVVVEESTQEEKPERTVEPDTFYTVK